MWSAQTLHRSRILGPPRELVSRPSLLFWTRGTLLSVGPNSKSSGGSNQSPVMILFIHTSLPPAGHPIPGAPTMKIAGKSDRQPFPSLLFPCSWYIYPTITGYNLRKYIFSSLYRFQIPVTCASEPCSSEPENIVSRGLEARNACFSSLGRILCSIDLTPLRCSRASQREAEKAVPEEAQTMSSTAYTQHGGERLDQLPSFLWGACRCDVRIKKTIRKVS